MKNKIGKKLEQYLQSVEPGTRSAALLQDSAKRMRISKEALLEIVKPFTVYIQRLPVPIMGRVFNIVSGIVLHNRARGPYKGGIRIAKDVDIWETTELARLMTLKTALADVELGGGKSGISVDLRALYADMVREDHFAGSFREFERMAKADIMAEFTDHFGWLFLSHRYIPAPDMGSGGAEMVRIYNDTFDPAAVTGKPDGIEGWLPGRKEATGYGVYYAMIKDMERKGKTPDECMVALQGFGKVGMHAAIFLHEAGARIIGVTDMSGGVQDLSGLDVPALAKHVLATGEVASFEAKSLTNARLFRLNCDYLIPAASGHVINADNAKSVGASVVVEAANMPVTYEGMEVLNTKEVEILPDTYANAGGVIASNIEYRQALGGVKFTREDTYEHIRERFDAMYDAMAPLMKKGRTMPEASTDIALRRVYDTMIERRLL
jgi:glutamate dehydrogenase (NAD(P)+)